MSKVCTQVEDRRAKWARDAKEFFPAEPIQWHLATSALDYCVKCGGPLGFLGRRERMCLGACNDGTGYRLAITSTCWLDKARKLCEEGIHDRYLHDQHPTD